MPCATPPWIWPCQDHRIDHGAAIMHHDIFPDLQIERLGIELDDHRMHAVRRGAARRSEILRGFQSRLGAGLDRAAHRIGALRKFAEPDEFFGDAGDRDLAVGEHEVVLGTLKGVAGEFQGFLAHRERGFIHGIARHHRAAAGKGAGAPIEAIGIAGDDIDIGDLDAELIGNNLRKAR